MGMGGMLRCARWQRDTSISPPDCRPRCWLAVREGDFRRDCLRQTDHVANPSRTENLSFENCLHTYFSIGDVAEVEITGLKGTTYIDKVDNFTPKLESADAVRISSETDRVYLDTTGAVEVHDFRRHRKIRVEKIGSVSTVVWNPWAAKAKQMSDFGEDEYKQMVCVEAGNVARNKINLAPGKSASLKVILSSPPI
jgi:D-hexose-6-phosphate mutarotase